MGELFTSQPFARVFVLAAFVAALVFVSEEW